MSSTQQNFDIDWVEGIQGHLEQESTININKEC